MATFDRERFEADARAAAPPMPEDMTPPGEALMDRDWFFYSLVGIGLIIIVGVGWL